MIEMTLNFEIGSNNFEQIRSFPEIREEASNREQFFVQITSPQHSVTILVFRPTVERNPEMRRDLFPLSNTLKETTDTTHVLDDSID